MIYLDGDKVTTDRSEPYGYNFKFTVDQAGNHEFKVVAQDDNGNKGEASVTLEVTLATQ